MEEVVTDTTICDSDGNCREVITDEYAPYKRSGKSGKHTETIVDKVDCKDGDCQETIVDTVKDKNGKTTFMQEVMRPFTA